MADEPKKPVCGIVMPLSAIDGCSDGHWADVRAILSAAIDDAGFDANLVSDADDVGIIHKRIIQNLYDNPMVVCDVSGKNPNVMFELGLRLAFDKPTIIVKDEKTAYSFDTGQIEHLVYPRDLRFQAIVDFKAKLAAKVQGTFAAAKDPKYTTFLKHFGEFTVAKIDQKEVPELEFILEELRSMRQVIARLDRNKPEWISHRRPLTKAGTVERKYEPGFQAGCAQVVEVPGVRFVDPSFSGDGFELSIEIGDNCDVEYLEKVTDTVFSSILPPVKVTIHRLGQLISVKSK